MLSDTSVRNTLMPPQSVGAPDDFQTPPEALDPLLPYIKGKKVWECAAGKGQLSNYLRNLGFDVIASDLYCHGDGVWGGLGGKRRQKPVSQIWITDYDVGTTDSISDAH